MEIGVNGFDRTLGYYYRDLGLTWVKVSRNVADVEPDNYREELAQARAWGMRIVIDLRTPSEWMQIEGAKLAAELAAQGKLEQVPTEDGIERLDAIFRNEQIVHAPLQEKFADACAKAAADYAEWVDDFEVWGESDCPFVTGGAFGGDIRVYSAYLELTYDAIKAVRPGARVWTGGNGFDCGGISASYFQAIVDDQRGDRCDVANWHPYHMYVDLETTADEQAAKTAKVYADVRALLKAKGKDQPFAATEWGHPSLCETPPEFERYLRSWVVERGVRQLTATEALEWAEADLQTMYDAGFQVVCLDRIVDTEPARFWGHRTGIITAGYERKPVYEVIREWAGRGQDEAPAFAGWVS